MEEEPKDLWEDDVDSTEEELKDLWEDVVDTTKHQQCAINRPTTESAEEPDEKAVYMDDLEKRKLVYGICAECNEPGTGHKWCQPCNAKRFKEDFENWTSGNKDIDELIQQSQQDALWYANCLEWIPFEDFHDVNYIAKGGFGKIYTVKWFNGFIRYWDIVNQEWHRYRGFDTFVLKSLDNSSSSDFLDEVKSHLQIYLDDVVQCFGITQCPNTKEYMMVFNFYEYGNLRNYLNQLKKYMDYTSKIVKLRQIARGLLDIHKAGKIHKDFHSGNILINIDNQAFISDLGMCQPVNEKKSVVKKEGIYGVLPYLAPEVLRGYQYTKASDIYSFGIIMNEFISEETPYNNIPHNHILAFNVCKGLRPNISQDMPKLLADLIAKCWDAKAENRPTAKELYYVLNKWKSEIYKIDKAYEYDGVDDDYDEVDNNNIEYSEIYSQIQECDKISESKFKSRSNEDKSNKSLQTHPQAIYTSRLLNFKNLPEPVNSSDLSSFQFTSDASYTNLISDFMDIQLTESELNEIYQDGEKNVE